MNLIIDRQPLQLMIRDAQGAFPDECCGFLFGEETDVERNITDAYAVYNSQKGDRRRRFCIDAFDYLEAERYAEENNLQLLGVYHSHPLHPAVPSTHDLAAAQPFFSYIILSVNEEKVLDIRSWNLNEENQFEEEKIIKPVLT